MIEKILSELAMLQKTNYEAYETATWNNDKIAYINASNAFSNAMTIVQEVAKEYDWIPVSERPPEPFQKVLVYDAWDDSMTIEHLQENDSFIDSVVAWMPLPIAPYQKGE